MSQIKVMVVDDSAVVRGVMNQIISTQPLVQLDSRQYAAALEQANATIAARKADIERGKAELLQEQANIAQARAQLDGARSSEAHAIDEVKRYEPLVIVGSQF